MDLRVFCEPSVDYKRYAIQAPWVFDGWEYATDGWIAVRVPTKKKDSPAKDAPYPKAYRIFAKFTECRRPWPDWECAPLRCRDCVGKGKYQGKKCRSCGGKGKIMAPVGEPGQSDFVRRRLDTVTIVTIRGRFFNAWYLGLIESQCKQLKYRLPQDDCKPLVFTASGGVQGLLAGIAK